MSYIYILLWLFGKNIMKCDGIQYKGVQRAPFSGHVVGGVEVPITMYPHVVVFIVDRHLCGGSIVSDRLVLTAGHCVVSSTTLRPHEPEKFQVYLGSAYRGRGKIYKVCKVVPHELYNSDNKLETNYFYDIAVLILRDRVQFGPSIRKVEIASSESWRKEKNHFTVAGFGLVETRGALSEKLLATRMHYINSKTCNESQSYNGGMIVPDHMFCMIGRRWTSDCFGDSGSGVIWRGLLVGVVSTGRDNFCGADVIPSMYTDATYFRKWIYSKMKEADSLSGQDCQPKPKQKKLLKQQFDQWCLLN